MQPHGFTARTSFTVTDWETAVLTRSEDFQMTRQMHSHFVVNLQTETPSPRAPPDDDNDAVEAVVGVLDVAKEAESQHLQQHLETEQTCEHHVRDLQNICQLLRLKSCLWREKEERLMYRYWTGTEKNEQINRDRQPGTRINMLRISKMLFKATV